MIALWIWLIGSLAFALGWCVGVTLHHRVELTDEERFQEHRARWIRMMEDARKPAQPCPLCLDTWKVKVYVEGDKPCPWCVPV